MPVDPPLFLAPMAGHSTHALRTLCREQGDCGFVCSELLSSQTMSKNLQLGRAQKVRSYKRFDWTPEESPFAVQLYGKDPAMMARAARFVVEHGAAVVDINMGCWVPKIARKGGGAGLLRDVETAAAVVAAVVAAVAVPVTVKVRSGWSDEELTAVEFAQAAETLGAAAVAVHARTAQQGFTGEANWDIIRQVKDAVRHIPVIGNGDVFTPADAARMFRETGCDGIMIGRGALGRPWVFRQIAHELRTGDPLPAPALPQRAALALRHARLSVNSSPLPEQYAVHALRGQLSKYPLDAPGSRVVRSQLVRAESLAGIAAILEPLIAGEAAL